MISYIFFLGFPRELRGLTAAKLGPTKKGPKAFSCIWIGLWVYLNSARTTWLMIPATSFGRVLKSHTGLAYVYRFDT